MYFKKIVSLRFQNKGKKSDFANYYQNVKENLRITIIFAKQNVIIGKSQIKS